MLDNDIWTDEEQPWLENDGFVQTIIDKVAFFDILDKYGLEYQKTGARNSSCKLRCPFPSHMNGEERTPSLHISNENLFKCFGCNAGGTIIEFVMHLRGMPRFKAIEEIARISGLTKCDVPEDYIPVYRNPDHTVLPYIYKAGIIIREYLKSIKDEKEYYKWEKRSKKWFKRLDYYMLELEDDQWETVYKYYEEIKNFVEKNGVIIK